MADTASLVVRVTQTGADQTAKSLDRLASASTGAQRAAGNMAGAQDKAAKATTNYGSVAQQAGYQVQDMVVQLQMGTSAFVAIGQQVPQFLGAFGPMGAIAGTVVALGSAIGGVLYSAMGDSTDGAAELERATKALDAVMRDSDGAKLLTDEIIKLARASEHAARAKIAVAMADAQVQIKAAGNAAQDAAMSMDSFFSTLNTSGSIGNATKELEAYRRRVGDMSNVMAVLDDSTLSTYNNLGATRKYVRDLSDEFGISGAQALDLTMALGDLTKAKTPEALKASADKASELAQATNYANPALNQLSATLQTAYMDMRNGMEATEALKKALNDLGGAADAAEAKMRSYAAEQIEALRIQTLAGEEQVKAAAELKKRQIREDAALNEQEKAQAIAHIDTLAAIQIKDQQDRAAAAKAMRDESAKLDAEMAARKAENAKRGADAYLAQLAQSNMSEMQLINEREREKKARLDEYHKQGLVSAQQYQNALFEIETNAVLARAEIQNEILDDESKRMDERRDAAIKAEKEIAEAKEKTINDGIDAGNRMTESMRIALGENNDLYKATAITMATIDTYKAANAAYAAMAGIPVVGPALAIAAAGAAVAAGMANVSAIAGAREQGGYMTGGSAYQMAERGKAEVIIPAGNSRAKTIQQMNELMGGNSSSTTNNQITVNASGNASPESIARAVDRALKRKSKKTDNAVYDSMNRGRKNRGARFNA